MRKLLQSSFFHPIDKGEMSLEAETKYLIDIDKKIVQTQMENFKTQTLLVFGTYF